MGGKPSNKRNLNEMKILTELARIKVIDPIRYIFKKSSNLVPISEILLEFIKKRKISILKDFFLILVKIMEAIQSILETRKKYKMKLFLVDFDKFYYDSIENTVIYDDVDSLSKNYEFSFLITDQYVKRMKKISDSINKNNNEINYSIQPFLYTEKENETYKRLFKNDKIHIRENVSDYYYKQSQIFYSNLILNFVRNEFKKASIIFADSSSIEKVFYEFRAEVLSKISRVTAKNISHVKNVLSAILYESFHLKEIVSFYEFFGVRHAISCVSLSDSSGDSENNIYKLKFCKYFKKPDKVENSKRKIEISNLDQNSFSLAIDDSSSYF